MRESNSSASGSAPSRSSSILTSPSVSTVPSARTTSTFLDIGVGLAVLQRVGAGRVVPDGPAERGLWSPPRGRARTSARVRRGARSGRRGSSPVGPSRSGVRVRVEEVVHVAGEVEDDGLVDGLTGEARPAAAREDRNPLLGAVGDDGRGVVGRLGEDDADGRPLVDARVRRVEFPGVVSKRTSPETRGLERRRRGRGVRPRRTGSRSSRRARPDRRIESAANSVVTISHVRCESINSRRIPTVATIPDPKRKGEDRRSERPRGRGRS